MTDPRIETLAENLVNYSCSVKPGEKVLIETRGFEVPLTKALVKEVYRAGGLPFVTIKNDEILRAVLLGCSEEQISLMARFELDRMKEMDAYIGIRYADNASELGDVPEDRMKLYATLFNKPVHSEQRVEHTKWVILRYPNSAMAQMAEMSTEAFEDHYFRVCNLDYAKMSRAMDGLVELINRRTGSGSSAKAPTWHSRSAASLPSSATATGTSRRRGLHGAGTGLQRDHNVQHAFRYLGLHVKTTRSSGTAGS